MACPPDIDLRPYLPLMGVLPDRAVAKRARVAVSAVAAYRKERGIPEAGSASTGKPSKLAPFHDLMGHLPDSEIASMAGASVSGVYGYRRRHGIPLDPEVAKRPSSSPPEKRRVVASAARDAREDEGFEAVRRYYGRLGRYPDSEIAKLAGVGSLTVVHYRAVNGIPAYQPPPGRRRSKLEHFADLVGTVPDEEIAAMAEVAVEAVRTYRSRHRIPATWRREDAAPGEGAGPGYDPGFGRSVENRHGREVEKAPEAPAAPPREAPATPEPHISNGSKVEPDPYQGEKGPADPPALPASLVSTEVPEPSSAPRADLQAYAIIVEGTEQPLYLVAEGVFAAWDMIVAAQPEAVRAQVKAIRWLGPGLR